MATHCHTTHSLLQPPFPFLNNQFRPQTIRRSIRFKPSISCRFSKSSSHDEENKNKNQSHLLKQFVTLTVISTSLPQPALAAKVATEKKRTAKKVEALTLEEFKLWSEGLPVVRDRIPYTDILILKEEGKLKHIIKPPIAALRKQPECVLVVLDDSRVLRTVLPSVEGNPKFWRKWDELRIDSSCMNAYTPPVKKPEVPKPFLGFVERFPLWKIFDLDSDPKLQSDPQYKSGAEKEMGKLWELKREREELKRQKNYELREMKREMEMMEKGKGVQKRSEEKKRRKQLRKVRYKESVRQTIATLRSMKSFWSTSTLEHFGTALGFLFFIFFYRFVVLAYKQKKKDYEDRIKIERHEAEEKRKMRALEREMDELQDSDDDEEEGKGDEKNPALKMAMQFMKSGARVRRARNRRLPQYLERDVDVKFSDVAGLGKIRVELEEVVKFFTEADMYRRRGIKIPGGILLCGPPGVGKTLLAKAVAGEAGVNFFSISASQFVEIYVGVGAARVRSLYEEARDNAPAVVFIDELDAVGRERGLIKGSGGKERDATLNQLLVCLDGFEGKGEVITIASTNRPDILDPALVRPGRFDRKIFVPRPSLIGRIEILKVHARKKMMAEDVDYMAVASVTGGMVGAELANVVEIAALNVMRAGRTEITTDDLLQAAQMEELGLLQRKERSPEMWKRIALNEAALAVVAVNFPDTRNIEFITIAPRAGRELGYVRMKTDHVKVDAGLQSRRSLLDQITVQLAPRAADEIWHGEGQLSTMWAESTHEARSAARAFVLGGLSEKHHGYSLFWTAERMDEIDVEAMRILDKCYERSKVILQRNRKLLDIMVDELVQKRSLTKKEFFNLVQIHGSLEPDPPSIVDIRVQSSMQPQDNMVNQTDSAVLSNI
ncbi:Probable inactive ATP-dependent zinc metalloprotease FTSHI 2, chloroplastic [Dionaea muscipula]